MMISSISSSRYTRSSSLVQSKELCQQWPQVEAAIMKQEQHQKDYVAVETFDN